MIRCVRKLKFDAGHRVFGHEGKCNFAHGTNEKRYIYEINNEYLNSNKISEGFHLSSFIF